MSNLPIFITFIICVHMSYLEWSYRVSAAWHVDQSKCRKAIINNFQTSHRRRTLCLIVSCLGSYRRMITLCCCFCTVLLSLCVVSVCDMACNGHQRPWIPTGVEMEFTCLQLICTHTYTQTHTHAAAKALPVTWPVRQKAIKMYISSLWHRLEWSIYQCFSLFSSRVLFNV